jgi:hypothetical protein
MIHSHRRTFLKAIAGAAGRVETGRDSISDPALGVVALGDQFEID